MHVYVHAGMHKTGTTSFQVTLNEHRQALLAEGVLVVTPKDKPPVSPSGFPQHYISDLILQAKAEGASKLIISHESISMFDEEGLKRLRAEIRPCEARFIIVFRHWCNYLPSRWSQNCKRRDSASFFKFLDATNAEQPWVQFDKIIMHAHRSGFDELIPISFENTGRSLLDDLFEACELRRLFEFKRANGSLPLRLTEKLRFFNAARTATYGLPPDELLTRLSTGKPVETFFDQVITVRRLLARLPELDTALDKKIEESLKESVLLPEQFSTLNERLQEAVGKVVFSGIEPHRRKYSMHEFDALEPELQSQMIVGLRQTKVSLASRLKARLAASVNRSGNR